MKAAGSISSHGRERIACTWFVHTGNIGSSEHLASALSRWSRFVVMLFRHPGRVHTLHENEGPSSHAGVRVILDSAGMHDLQSRSLYLTTASDQAMVRRIPALERHDLNREPQEVMQWKSSQS